MTLQDINIAVISALYKKQTAIKVINNIEEHHLLEEYKECYRRITNFLKKYSRIPTIEELPFKQISSLETINLDWAIDELKNAHKKELLKEAIKNGAINLSNNNIDKAIDNIYRVLAQISLDDDEIEICDSKKNFMETYGESIRNKKSGQSIMTGLKSFDEFTGGFSSEELCFILGEPGVGKSFMLSYMAYNAMKAGKNVLFFNLDMGLDLTMSNFLIFETKIDRDKIYNGNFTPEEKKIVIDSIKNLNNDNKVGRLQIINGVFDIDKLYNYIISNTLVSNIDIIFIDQLSNIDDEAKDYIKSAVDTVKKLHKIVKKIKKPIIVASQLNRDFSKEKHTSGATPQRHHIGFTDRIQQASDSVLALYRDENNIMTFQIVKFRKKEHKNNKFKYEWHPPQIVEVGSEWYNQEVSEIDEFNFDEEMR